MYESKQIGKKKLHLKKRIKVGLEHPRHSAYITELSEKSVVIEAYVSFPKESIISCEMTDNDKIIKFDAEVISSSTHSIGNRIEARITNQFEKVRNFYLGKLSKKLNKTNEIPKKKSRGLFGFLKKFT